MKWIGVSGAWRITSQQVEKDVRQNVKNVIKDGNGIVTGGALNVDSFALDEVLKQNPNAQKIKVFLPVSLELYSAYYRKRAREGVITELQAEKLIEQLSKLKKINPKALVENRENKRVDQESYYERNTEVVGHADEMLVFQVNKSAGTQDAIDKAKKKNIGVKLFSYNM